MKAPCKYPGCPTLISRHGYCEKHQLSAPNPRRDYDRGRRAKDPALSQAAAIRSSARWKRVAKAKLSESPMCEDPLNEHERRNTTATATQVHHIEGLVTRPELAFSWSNLMSVCTGCHARIEAEERKSEKD